MATLFTGSCMCGAVWYVCSAEPLFFSIVTVGIVSVRQEVRLPRFWPCSRQRSR
jgi:hypothetical protein